MDEVWRNGERGVIPVQLHADRPATTFSYAAFFLEGFAEALPYRLVRLTPGARKTVRGNFSSIILASVSMTPFVATSSMEAISRSPRTHAVDGGSFDGFYKKIFNK